MTVRRNPLALIRRAAWPAAGLLIIAYFLGAAVVGENGVLAWGDYRRAKAERGAELARLEARAGAARPPRAIARSRATPIPTSPRRWSGASSAWSGPTR